MIFTYIDKFLDDKVFAVTIPVAGEYIFGVPLREPDDVIPIGLALALRYFPVNVSIVPIFLFHRCFRRLRGRGRVRRGR